MTKRDILAKTDHHGGNLEVDGEWSILIFVAPGYSPRPVGILMVDCATDQLHMRLVEELHDQDETINEVWAELEDELAQQALRFGGRGVLNWLEDSASHTFRIGCRSHITVPSDPDEAVDRLFSENVPLMAKRNVAG